MAKCSIKTRPVLISTKRMMEIRLDLAYWLVHTEIKLRKISGIYSETAVEKVKAGKKSCNSSARK